MNQSAPPQYSADRKWWWDGYKWVAVNAEGTVDKGSVAETATPETSAPPLVRQKTPTALLVIAAVVMGLIVLSVVGFAIFGIWISFRGAPARTAESGAGSNSSYPSSQPSMTFPTLPAEKYSYKYFPGTTVSSVVKPLLARGFKCTPPEAVGDLGLANIDCLGKDQASGVQYSALLQARGETQVNEIDGLALSGGDGEPDLSKSLLFLDVVAAYPFQNQSDLARQATGWTDQNVT
ncbi:MAG: hypothetical protein ACREP9_07940, partial [Candidatus Dormibacteraceae bacterium]